MENNKILILVVIYKCTISQSETIKSLSRQHLGNNCHIFLWDNSPMEMDPQELKILEDLFISTEYFHAPENLPLSKVYNRVATTENNYDYLILFDQDSLIHDDYFKNLQQAAEQFTDVKLFLPIVKNGERIVSPGTFQFFKGKHWIAPEFGKISSKNKLAVTSGMVITKSYFETYKYKFCEKLNLYGIDSKFMLDFNKNEKYLYVLNSVIDHNSALWSNPSGDVLLPRFRNLRRAWSIILSDRPLALFLSNLYSVYLCVKLSLKYRDPRFLSLKNKS